MFILKSFLLSKVKILMVETETLKIKNGIKYEGQTK